MTDDESSTTAHQRGEAKRARHADAIASGEITFAHVQEERRAEFRARVAALPDADRAMLNDWAQRMAAQFGDQAVAHRNVVGWAEAFMVARYGEEVEHWPAALSAADEARLAQLDRGGRQLRFVRPLKLALALRRPGERLFADVPNREGTTTPREI